MAGAGAGIDAARNCLINAERQLNQQSEVEMER